MPNKHHSQCALQRTLWRTAAVATSTVSSTVYQQGCSISAVQPLTKLSTCAPKPDVPQAPAGQTLLMESDKCCCDTRGKRFGNVNPTIQQHQTKAQNQCSPAKDKCFHTKLSILRREASLNSRRVTKCCSMRAPFDQRALAWNQSCHIAAH